MTEKIQQIILAIRTKMVQMHEELVASREQNNILETENESLKSQIEELHKDREDQKVKLSELELQLMAAKEQVVTAPFSQSKKEEEIDELVKEIEYCISQLKK
jgi:chromosome segregation ATPase